MGTFEHDPIAAALFAKNRCTILALLFGHAEETFYLRQIARICGPGLGVVQRELAQLTAAGILRRNVSGRQVYYQANPDCPVFAELKGLVAKTTGVPDVLREALRPLADRIVVAFVFGSFARAQQQRDSDVDLAVVGEVDFGEVVDALANTQENLRWEVNPVVYSPTEYQTKLRENHHFVRSLVNGEKIFLIGGESELAGLAGQPLARRTREQCRRDSGPTQRD